jgi:hypothetical protein
VTTNRSTAPRPVALTLYRNEISFILMRLATGFICQEIIGDYLDWNDYKTWQAQLDVYLTEDNVHIKETPISKT